MEVPAAEGSMMHQGSVRATRRIIHRAVNFGGGKDDGPGWTIRRQSIQSKHNLSSLAPPGVTEVPVIVHSKWSTRNVLNILVEILDTAELDDSSPENIIYIPRRHSLTLRQRMISEYMENT